MPPQSSDLWDCRVLIVTGDRRRRKSLRDLVQREGFNSVACATASEAIERLRTSDIHVALIDDPLPDATGDVLAERIRRLQPKTRVVIHASENHGRPTPGVTTTARRRESLRSVESLIARVRTAVDLSLVEARQERESESIDFLDALPVGVFRVDHEGRIGLINSRAAEILGAGRAESGGVRWLDFVHDDDRDRLETEWRDLVARRGSLVVECRVREETRFTRWARLAFRPSPTPAQSDPEFIGAITDISIHKDAERRQMMLMRELDHRVKNNLAAVLALLDQTLASSPTIEEFRETYSGRIRALARTHEALAHASWRGVWLNDVVQLIIGPFIDPEERRVRLTGSPRLLPPKFCIPLCMALHELTTNAIKHGSLAKPEGTLTVDWSDSTAERLIITWTEQRSDHVTTPSRPGFGVSLLRGVVEYELGGVVEMNFEPSGLIARLEAPMEPDPHATGP